MTVSNKTGCDKQCLPKTHSVGDFINAGSEARRRTPAVYDIIHPEKAPMVPIQHKMTPGLPKPLC